MLEPCDLIIVEGYKSAPILKIEARRTGVLHAKADRANGPPGFRHRGRSSDRRRRTAALRAR